MNEPLVVSFWTPSYGPYGDKLEESLKRFGIRHSVLEMDSEMSGWSEAVSYKPKFILSCLEKNPCQDILWVDADAEFKSKPDWSMIDGCDVAWHKFKRSRNHEAEDLTGTMFFKNTDAVKALVTSWHAVTPVFQKTFTPEQDSLKVCFQHSTLAHKDMPAEWVWIYDDFPTIYGSREPVIVHYQASRVMRFRT